jgi:L-seryl-tRNA(Ser) seleniumtransferase
MSSRRNLLRSIPAVGKVLDAIVPHGIPRPVVVAIVRKELGLIRRRKLIPDIDEISKGINERLDELRRSRLRPVINGTGVIVNTNLGRAPLPQSALQAAVESGRAYSNLEFDLCKGKRGGRAVYAEALLAALCGADGAAVVNNCAAALVLMVSHFTVGARKEVIVSRGELIQIGGGFRIPDILESAGAVLREVGTTNKTTVEDYRRAAGGDTAIILKVHRSNFFMGGFTASPSSEGLATLARKLRVPLVEDLGSGALTATRGIAEKEREPTPKEVLANGVDLVCFSGDKLLGGPQAGLIVGRKRYVEALRRSPLFRALRCDKLILGVLQHTLERYFADTIEQDIPLLAMIAQPRDQLQVRAMNLAERLSSQRVEARVVDTTARIGGGALPRSKIPSVALEIKPRGCTPSQFAAKLRLGEPPIIGYLSGKRFLIDLKTVLPDQDAALVAAVGAVSQ